MPAHQVRQGHILLNPERIPTTARPVPPDKSGRVVLARGETGREHVFKFGRVNAYQHEGVLFIEVTGDDPVFLEHDEHGDIEIYPGTYRVVEQREQDIGFGNPVRRSFD